MHGFHSQSRCLLSAPLCIPWWVEMLGNAVDNQQINLLTFPMIQDRKLPQKVVFVGQRFMMGANSNDKNERFESACLVSLELRVCSITFYH